VKLRHLIGRGRLARRKKVEEADFFISNKI
jgi:hypothetical protein